VANPQAEKNYQTFRAFVQLHCIENDWDDYVLPDKLDLNKKRIARECEFDRKRITGNTKILRLYNLIKRKLVKKGILVTDSRSGTEKRQHETALKIASKDSKLMSSQQQQNASLQAQLYDVTRDLKEANEKLKHLKAIEDYLMATGRL